MAKVCVTWHREQMRDLNGFQQAVVGPQIGAATWLDTAGTKVTAAAPDGATMARIATDGKIVRNISTAGTAATADTHTLMHANSYEYVGIGPLAKIAIETQT